MKKAFFENNKIVQIFKEIGVSRPKHSISEHSNNHGKNPNRAITNKSFRTKQRNYIHFKDNLPSNKQENK